MKSRIHGLVEGDASLTHRVNVRCRSIPWKTGAAAGRRFAIFWISGDFIGDLSF